jgi:hypothetical protein
MTQTTSSNKAHELARNILGHSGGWAIDQEVW